MHCTCGVQLVAHPYILDANGHPEQRAEQSNREDKSELDYDNDLRVFPEAVADRMAIVPEKLENEVLIAFDDQEAVGESNDLEFLLTRR